MQNKLLEKLKAGEKPVGTFLSMGNPTLAECLSLSGLDYLIIDTEHGPFEVESALEIMRAVELGQATAMVRVKDGSRASILKMLDIGARALVIPNIHTVGEVKRIVEYGKFYPQGQRGMFMARPSGYGCADYARNFTDYLRLANEMTLLLPQCETKGCLDNIEEIAGLDGVAGIFVGHFDLSVGLGKPTCFEAPEFKEALKRIVRACAEARKYSFIFSSEAETAKRYLDQGFDSVVVSVDGAVLIQAFQRIVREVRG